MHDFCSVYNGGTTQYESSIAFVFIYYETDGIPYSGNLLPFINQVRFFSFKCCTWFDFSNFAVYEITIWIY